MNGKDKSIQEINARCRAGAAVVLTETEIWERARSGAVPDIDVAVFAFGASIRGSSAMLLVPVTGKGVFTRAESLSLNGVPTHPGPAPNERLGVVDAQLFADQTVEGAPETPIPPGARVLLEVLENRKIEVDCQSVAGGWYHNAFRMSELEFARMVCYNTFLPARLNGTPDRQPPVHLALLRIGSTVFLNRAPGIVIGTGTRSVPGRASLSLSADMLQMDPTCIERNGDVLLSLAIPLPVVNDAVRDSICRGLAGLSPREMESAVRPLDRETAAYVQQMIREGTCLPTESSLPIAEFLEPGTGSVERQRPKLTVSGTLT